MTFVINCHLVFPPKYLGLVK